MAHAWTSQVAHLDRGAPVAVQFRSPKGAIISVTLEPEVDPAGPDDAVAFARKMLSQCVAQQPIETSKARPSCETDEVYRFWATGR